MKTVEVIIEQFINRVDDHEETFGDKVNLDFDLAHVRSQLAIYLPTIEKANHFSDLTRKVDQFMWILLNEDVITFAEIFGMWCDKMHLANTKLIRAYMENEKERADDPNAETDFCAYLDEDDNGFWFADGFLIEDACCKIFNFTCNTGLTEEDMFN